MSDRERARNKYFSIDFTVCPFEWIADRLRFEQDLNRPNFGVVIHGKLIMLCHFDFLKVTMLNSLVPRIKGPSQSHLGEHIRLVHGSGITFFRDAWPFRPTLILPWRAEVSRFLIWAVFEAAGLVQFISIYIFDTRCPDDYLINIAVRSERTLNALGVNWFCFFPVFDRPKAWVSIRPTTKGLPG